MKLFDRASVTLPSSYQGERCGSISASASRHRWVERGERLDLSCRAADMAKAVQHSRLVTILGIGHSMNLEQPALYAGYVGEFFGGLGQ